MGNNFLKDSLCDKILIILSNKAKINLMLKIQILKMN